MATFDVNYPQNPWADMTTKTRDWYVPELYAQYARNAIYNRYVNVKFNMNGLGATQMHVSKLQMPHANFDPIGVRDYWLDSAYMDTLRVVVNFNRYAGKFSLNRYDDMVTYYLQDNVRGLRRIIQNGLGFHMTRLDTHRAAA